MKTLNYGSEEISLDIRLHCSLLVKGRGLGAGMFFADGGSIKTGCCTKIVMIESSVSILARLRSS